MEIGSKGLQEVNLTIPQGTSLTFNITHKDEEEHVVDHSQSTARMAFVGKDGNIQLDECCTCTESGVTVTIPASATATTPCSSRSLSPWTSRSPLAFTTCTR